MAKIEAFKNGKWGMLIEAPGARKSSLKEDVERIKRDLRNAGFTLPKSSQKDYFTAVARDLSVTQFRVVV